MITAIRALRVAWPLALFLALAPASDLRGAEAKAEVKVVAFGLFGDQSVFESEAKGAAQIVASRFGGGPVIVRANTKSREEVTSETLAATLQSTAKAMNVENDILFVILTSHGSRAGLAVKTPSRNEVEILSPLDLFTMLDRTQVRHRDRRRFGVLFGGFHTAARRSRHAGHHGGGCESPIVRLPEWKRVDLFWRRLFQHGAAAHRESEGCICTGERPPFASVRCKATSIRPIRKSPGVRISSAC